MAHQALYRRYRPLVFDDVVGQKHATDTIKNEVASGSVGHAFLFCGPRGTGKTTTARILSRAVNCQNPKDGNPCNECAACKGILNGSVTDVVEIDAASNSGVDNVRSLREEAMYPPALVKNRVYIIDEVHGLTKEAFNALLKLLEEPPSYVRFVLATTEANKVLATIASRCQRFDFKKITRADIYKRLEEICAAEKIEIETEALKSISEAADGSLRDALTILEPCVSKDKIVDTMHVRELLGLSAGSAAAEVVNAAALNDSSGVLSAIERATEQGINFTPFIEEVIKFFRAVMVFAVTNTPPEGIDPDDWETLARAVESMSAEKAIYAVTTLSEAYSKARYMTSPRYVIEAALLKLCNLRAESGIEALEARVGELEKKLERGMISPAPQKPELERAKESKPQPKKEEPKAEPKTEGSGVTSEKVQRIIEKWPEIKSRVTEKCGLEVFMALENSAIRPFGDKAAIVFDDRSGSVFRDMISGKLAELTELVAVETGESIKLTVKFESDFEDEKEKTESDPFDEIASLPFVNKI